MQREPLVTYKGSCHCSAVSFEFDSVPIVQAMQCNCSICIRKNAIMSDHYYEPEHFRLISGQESLACYRFGDYDVNHWFCKQCGIYPFHDGAAEPGKYRINLGCVEGLETRDLPLRVFDGRNLL